MTILKIIQTLFYMIMVVNLLHPWPSRDWLSFGVVWKSNSNTEKENVLVAYVGEVTIKINDDIIKLPNSYSSVNKEISIPKTQAYKSITFIDIMLG